MELKTTQEDKTHKQSRNWVLTQSRKERRERERERGNLAFETFAIMSQSDLQNGDDVFVNSRSSERGENVKKINDS